MRVASNVLGNGAVSTTADRTPGRSAPAGRREPLGLCPLEGTADRAHGQMWDAQAPCVSRDRWQSAARGSSTR